jgi:hypothetical protein
VYGVRGVDSNLKGRGRERERRAVVRVHALRHASFILSLPPSRRLFMFTFDNSASSSSSSTAFDHPTLSFDPLLIDCEESVSSQ